MSKEDKTMSIKAYCDWGNGKTEVRRFGLPESLATVFSALNEKVRNVFNLGGQDFKISWQDCDGDNVIISSDGELAEAIADSLNNEGSQLLRIYVTLKKNSKNSDNDEKTDNNNKEHTGVVCDGCDGKVIGFRYKCLSCNDYDLCSTCEGKGVHAQHQMIRIISPDDQSPFNYNRGPHGRFRFPHGPNVGGAWGNSGNFFPRPGMGQGWRRGCGRRGGAFHPQGWAPKCDFNQNKPNGSCPFNPFEDFRGMNEEMVNNAAKEASKQAANIMKGIWTAWSGQSPANAESASAFASASASAEAGKEGEAKSSSNATNKSTEPTSDAEYLHNIGKNVAEMLDPFGIDVQISVENNGVKQKCSVSKKDNSESSNRSEDDEKMQTEDNHYNEPEKKNETEMEDTAKEEEKNASETQSDNEEWMMVNDSSPQEASSPADSVEIPKEQTTNDDIVYPNLSTAPHPDPKIQRALDLLCQMGYKNDGGWLTNVLVMKNGDINQVLDMLHPITK